MKCPKCLRCQHFTWWDGDYVCMEKMSILSDNDGRMFDDNLVQALKKQNNCEAFSKRTSGFWTKAFEDEFAKWHELHLLEKQLERHVR